MKCIYCGKKGDHFFKNMCATCYSKIPYVNKFRTVCDDVLETIRKKQEITITPKELEYQKIMFAKKVSRDIVKCITDMVCDEHLYSPREFYNNIEEAYNISIKKHIKEKF